VSRLYELEIGRAAGGEAGAEGLEELEIQYADYAVWQREWMKGEVLEEQLKYWREQLHDAPALLELPTDRVRPAIKTYNGGYLKFGLARELSASVKRLSSQEGVTLFMTLLATFQVLLHRYTGQTDIVIGTPVANRNRSEIESLIGFFVNTLPIRGDLTANPKFSELRERVRERMLKAFVHQDLPFEQLVEALQVERSVSHTPIFQVVFTLQNTPFEVFKLPGLTLSRFEIETNAAKFDLLLEVADAPEGLRCAFEYNSDLFDEATIARMAVHYQRLLEAIVADPHQRIMALPLLGADEREALLAQCCESTKEYPKQQCLHHLFEAQTARAPDNIAVTCDQQQLTYQELNQRANRLAHQLRGAGIGPEALVAISIERSLEMIIGILGVLKAGGAYLPLDPSYPAERLAFMLRDSQAKVLLTQQSLREALPMYQGQVICLDEDWLKAAPDNDEDPSVPISPDNCAYVLYTSGSTGMPKGTMITHYNVVRLFQATDSCFDFDEHDVWSMFHSYGFDFSVWEMWGALLKGGRLVIVPYWVGRSPEAYYNLLSEQGVTILNQTPAAFRQLIRHEQNVGRSQFLRLRRVIFGGEALELESLRPWYEMHGDEQPQLVNMYGITETTVHVTYRALQLADIGKGSVVGRGLDDLQVYLLDEVLEPVPVGVAGEIYVAGGGLARGYLNRPELTAERFIPNPFSTQPGARLYRSGDIGRYLTDGGIEYLGRADQQVKVRGYRIELGEIESVLGQHISVREAVVVTREAKSGERSLTAYVVPDLGQEIQVSELRGYLKQKLPEYMMPASFVILDALPLTSHNKLDRRALPDPEPYHPALESTFIQPQTEMEKTLCDIWQTALQIEGVGINDNFFDLGGHSLLVVQVQHSILQDLNITVPIVDLFLHPTISSLSKHLSQQQPEMVSFQQVTDEARRQKDAINRQRQIGRRKRQEI
jgi:amino acid adenylation domain-containing protein